MKQKCALIVYGYIKVYDCVCMCMVYVCVLWCYGCVHSVCRHICAWYMHVSAPKCESLLPVCTHGGQSVHQVLPLLLSTLVFKMRVNVLHVCLCSTSYVPGADGGQKRVSDPLELELYIRL